MLGNPTVAIRSISILTDRPEVGPCQGPSFATIKAIKAALMDYKHRIRNDYRFYSQDLINNLFNHPYTKIDFVERDLKVSRLTATKYLDALAGAGFVQKVKVGRSNYYVNVALNAILTQAEVAEKAVR